MSRFLLDTNILVYILLSQFDNLSTNVKDVIYDYNNQLYVSSIVVMELIQLQLIMSVISPFDDAIFHIIR